MTEHRSEFEAWARDEEYGLLEWEPENDCYRATITQRLWRCYQAARASLRSQLAEQEQEFMRVFRERENYKELYNLEKAIVVDIESELAQCYKLSGADPDDNVDAMLAPRAVEEVKRLRKDYGEACQENEGLRKALACAQSELEQVKATLRRESDIHAIINSDRHQLEAQVRELQGELSRIRETRPPYSDQAVADIEALEAKYTGENMELVSIEHHSTFVDKLTTAESLLIAADAALKRYQHDDGCKFFEHLPCDCGFRDLVVNAVNQIAAYRNGETL